MALSLQRLNQIPDGFLEWKPHELRKKLGQPTLFELPGNSEAPVFVSTLLHGNELTGWYALQKLFTSRDWLARPPRPLLIFIGNIFAAEKNERRLEGQPDYNRLWRSGTSPEGEMAREVLRIVRERKPFAAIDIHNNTGRNPLYACVSHIEPHHLRLAELFGRTVVHSPCPESTLCHAFSEFVPSVTLECGQSGEATGIERAADLIRDCVHLSHFPPHALLENEIDLYESRGRVFVRPGITFAMENDADAATADLVFFSDMDKWNFSPLPVGTVFAKKRVSAPTLFVEDEGKNQLPLFEENGDAVTLRESCVPAMLTPSKKAIEQDCVGYLMERIPHRVYST
jgi:hypothetical protein